MRQITYASITKARAQGLPARAPFPENHVPTFSLSFNSRSAYDIRVMYCTSNPTDQVLYIVSTQLHIIPTAAVGERMEIERFSKGWQLLIPGIGL